MNDSISLQFQLLFGETSLLPELEAMNHTVVLEPVNDARRLCLHRDLRLGALLPELKAVDETAVLEPVNDAKQLLLHRDLLLGVLLPELEAVDETAVLEPVNDARRLCLHRDLLLGVLLPELEAMNHTVVLEPVNDMCGFGLQAFHVVCAAPPCVKPDHKLSIAETLYCSICTLPLLLLFLYVFNPFLECDG